MFRKSLAAAQPSRRKDQASSAMMCGAPVLPPIAMRKPAAPDVMDVVGSPFELSTPSGSTFSETSAPPYGTPSAFSMESQSGAPYAALAKQRLMAETSTPPFDTPPAFSMESQSDAPYAALASKQLMAEAEWWLAAELQFMLTPSPRPFATAPAKPYRKRDQGSPTTAMPMRGAPVPPPMKLRYVSKHPPPDVIDAGSSAPSTPPSDCSSWETTPSPRGPLPAFTSNSAAPCGQATARQVPPRPFPTEPEPAPPRVEVRQVWAHNFATEAALIELLLSKFRYVAVDTEFPGTAYRPAGSAYTPTPEKRYELLRLNVNALDLIQVGLTLFDSGGRLPGLGGATRYVWEFNFREFDVRRHHHTPESIAMLRAKGVDFDRTRQYGVAAADFGPRLRKWLRSGLGRAGVVTFSGGYDIAYLVKVMYGPGFKMPELAAEFEGIAKAALTRRRLFDVKEMARFCPSDLHGGLDSLAVKLNVGRAVGEAHQAASDSLLTCHAFMKMRESYFDDDDKLARVAGFLTDVTATAAV